MDKEASQEEDKNNMGEKLDKPDERNRVHITTHFKSLGTKI